MLDERGDRCRAATPTTTRCARCWAGAGAAALHRDHGLRRSRPSEFDAAVAELRVAIRDATRAATTFGYGPRFLHSTGQLHKGGPPSGRFLAADRTTATRTSRSRAPATRSARSSTRRRSATWRRCARTACRPRACARGRPGGGAARARRRGSRRCSDADRLRRAGQDGRQHGRSGSGATPTTRSSPSTSTRRPSRRPKVTARRGATSLARPGQEARAAARRCGSWCRPATRPRRRSTRWRSCSTQGDTIIDGGNSRWTDDMRATARSCAKQGIHYVDVGTSGGVWGLEVGYCMMVGGADAAVERLAPILDVLARRPEARLAGPHGPERRRPLREDGPQRRSSTG